MGEALQHVSLSKPDAPALRPGGRASSVRSSSRGGDDEKNTVNLKDFGLDVIGDENMAKQLWVLVKGKQVVQARDGRKCTLCPMRDSTWCPVAITLHRLKQFVCWSKGRTVDGRTQGSQFWRCCRYITTHVAKLNIQGITVFQYEQTVSLDPSGSLLQRHQTII